MLRFLPAYTAFVNSLSNLVARLDAAVRLDNPKDITQQVKLDLEAAINDGQVVLPERFLQTRPEGYARRLLYRSEELGYTAVVMTWAAGQRTPLHDHAGIWCVEGVVEGRMDVTQYDLLEERDGGYRFEVKGCVHAAVGSTGCLIPPFEYHILANALDRPSITLHVYGGEMTMCHVFEPLADGRYVRKERALKYND